MEEERQSDTEQTFGEASIPQSASNQQGEEPSVPQQDAGDQGTAHRDPADEDEGRGDRSGEAGRPGGAGEHSQATGSETNAG